MNELLTFPALERSVSRPREERSRVTREQVEAALVEDSPAAGQEPSLPVRSFTTSSGYLPPLYQFERDIEAMVAHPSIAAPLGYYKAGLSAAQHVVEATSTDVEKFVTMTIRDFWERSLGDSQISYEYARIGCEVIYAKNHGLMQYEAITPFSPWDTTPHVGVESHQYAGFALKGVPDCTDPEGVFFWTATDDMPGKGFWLVHRPRFNPFWGRSQLWGAWRPWRRLAGRDGGEDITDAAVYRLGYRGPTVFYKPDGVKATRGPGEKDPAGLTINRDVARTIAEQVKAGASSYFPSIFDDHGNRVWDMVWPEYAFNCAPLLDYLKALHDQCSLGVGVPPELLQASETGSGYSGRQIPLEGYFMGQQENATALTEAFVRQVVRPLVRWNFGPDADFKVRVLPILESRQKQAAASNPQPPQPDLPGAGAKPAGQPSPNGAPRPPQPGPPTQRLATAEAIPEAESIATTLATTARTELLEALRQVRSGDWMSVAGDLLQQYADRFADALSGTRLAAMLLGAREVGDRLRMPARAAVTVSPSTAARTAEPPPGTPPPWTYTAAETGAAGEGIHLPLIEAAAKDLEDRGIFTRANFDALDVEARREAFTVTGVETETVLSKIRDALHDSVARGTGLDEFVAQVEDQVGKGTFLSEAHAENVFRTNVQSAYSHGMDAILDHPLVADQFPFEAVDPILDARVRPHHRRLATGGLDGTNIYLATDSIYQTYLKPPAGWSCRCGRTPITMKQAAARGVQVAMDYLERGVPLPKKQFDGVPTWWVVDPRWVRMGTRMATEVVAESHKFASTQFNLPDDVATMVKMLAARIPDDELAEDGREDQPHVTIKYGLHTDDANAVRMVVEPLGPVVVTLGPVSIFSPDDNKSQRGGDKYDVVKIDVVSPDLHRLNAAIAAKLEVTDTHPEYTPYVTIAYVKAGEGRKYVGDKTLDDVTLMLDRVVFSDTSGNRTEIELLGPVRMATDVHGAEHKASGPGGGQFVPKGKAGTDKAKSKDKSKSVNKTDYSHLKPQFRAGGQAKTQRDAAISDWQDAADRERYLNKRIGDLETVKSVAASNDIVDLNKQLAKVQKAKAKAAAQIDATEPETSAAFKTRDYAAVMAKIEAEGLNEWPKKGPKATEILGDHPDTMSLHSTENPDGTRDYSPERVESVHDKIVEQFLSTGKPPADGVKRVLFMAGGTASGKSSGLAQRPDVVPEGAVHLDPDEIKKQLPEYDAMIKAKDRYAANGAHNESSDIARRIQLEAISRGLPVVIDGTGNSGEGKFAAKFEEMHNAGYEISALYVNAALQDAIPRAIDRAEKSGRFVPIPELKRMHKGVSVNFPSVAKLPYVKDLHVYDTTGNAPGDPARLIASGGGGKVRVHNDDEYQAFLAKANE